VLYLCKYKHIYVYSHAICYSFNLFPKKIPIKSQINIQTNIILIWMNIILKSPSLAGRLTNYLTGKQSSFFSASACLLSKSKKSIEEKNEVLTIVSPTKKTAKAKNRLYVWGYTGTGALGNSTNKHLNVRLLSGYKQI
jgi:hypothetical protein